MLAHYQHTIAVNIAAIATVATDVAVFAAEPLNSFPAASNGLPPPLWPASPVCSLPLAEEVRLGGMLGASKIWEDCEVAALLFSSVADVLVSAPVGAGDELVSIARLVGTSL